MPRCPFVEMPSETEAINSMNVKGSFGSSNVVEERKKDWRWVEVGGSFSLVELGELVSPTTSANQSPGSREDDTDETEIEKSVFGYRISED